MKRFTTILLLLLLLVTTGYANPIDPEKAGEIANKFWNSNLRQANQELLILQSPAKMAKAGSRIKIKESNPQYYIYTPEESNGFIIVSGDDVLAPIVGYSTEAINKDCEMPAALVEWLNEYSMYVDDVRAGKAAPAQRSATTEKTAIAPMLETTWNQGAPYNNLCPEAYGQKTPTGCTATAMAQIMKFHEWPITPTKAIVWESNITGKKETIDLTKRTYNWDNMLPHYRNSYTTKQAQEVAQLMVDVGKAINSSYSPEGTGSNEIYVSYALVNIFDYSPEAKIVRRSDYTENEYISIIRENLEARLPLLYTGHSQSYNSGHAFVCDGIDERDLLHIDWGWDGAYNGYFDMTYMSPEGTGIGGGDGRYNVAQTIIANIHPREKSEADVPGTPVVYMMDVVDATVSDNPQTLLEQTINYDHSGVATTRIAAGLLNWSHSSINMTMFIGLEKDNKTTVTKIGNSQVVSFNNSLGYYIYLTVSNNQQDENYLEKGSYKIKVCYSDDNGENVYVARGSDNGLIMEVGENSVTIRKELPEIEVTEIMFHTTPQMEGDGLAFDAKFKTNNGKSATVLIVPVINKLQDNNTYSSTVATSDAVLIQVHDDRDIHATFNTSYMFPDNGKYFISFKYNIKNNYIDREIVVNKATLQDIAGRSENLDISKLPDGAVLSTIGLSATSGIAWGSRCDISYEVKNIANTDDAYTGTIGLCIKEKTTGEEHLLVKNDINGLAKGNTLKFLYKNNDYFPVVKPGNYTIYLCEFVNGTITPLKQSAATCTMQITGSTATTLYSTGHTLINNGNDVLKGDSFTATLKITSKGGDFNGYVRADTPVGVTYYTRSEYVEVSIKEGETKEVTLQCKTTAKIPVEKRRLDVYCYGTDKKKIGDVSGNTLTYRNNGYFWVCDETGINEVENSTATVHAYEGYISITGADAYTTVKVYSADGREIYSGNSTTIPTSRGLYIVTVTTNGNTTATKLFVK